MNGIEARPAGGALVTWTCEGCGRRQQTVVPVAACARPVASIPLPGWRLVRDPVRGALAFCARCG